MRALHTFFTVAAMATIAGCTTQDVRAPAAPATANLIPQQAEPVATEPVPAVPALDRRAVAVEQLASLAPDADPGVLALALEARECAVRNGQAGANARLAVIDFSRPSTQKRLWVFDLAQHKLLYREHVTHGQGSGENMATRFSNIEGSYQTSLGLYRTAETYIGGNGYSLRLDGLDRGFNDQARPRAIVMHGAWYANPELIAKQGRLGRSQGCPALREGVARQVIDTLKGEHLVFHYANDARFLREARSFACEGRSAQQILAPARAPRPRTGGGATVAIAAP